MTVYVDSRPRVNERLVFIQLILILSKCDIVIVDIDECKSSSCQNGASCTDAINSYTCACVAGYTGVNCETGECMLL